MCVLFQLSSVFFCVVLCVCGLFYGVYAYNLTIPYPTFWVMVAYDKNASTQCVYFVPSIIIVPEEVGTAF